MPTYRYRCEDDRKEFEVWQSITDDSLTTHEGCGGRLVKVLSPAGIVLKGSGFYKTDNRSSSRSTSNNGDGSKDNGSKDNGSSSSDSSKSDSSGSSGSSDSGSKDNGAKGNGAKDNGAKDNGSSSSGSGSKPRSPSKSS